MWFFIDNQHRFLLFYFVLLGKDSYNLFWSWFSPIPPRSSTPPYTPKCALFFSFKTTKKKEKHPPQNLKTTKTKLKTSKRKTCKKKNCQNRAKWNKKSLQNTTEAFCVGQLLLGTACPGMWLTCPVMPVMLHWRRLVFQMPADVACCMLPG